MIIFRQKRIIDKWKNEYIYTLINDDKDFIIKSLGSDKKEGGEGTKKDIFFSSTNIENEFGDATEFDYAVILMLNN